MGALSPFADAIALDPEAQVIGAVRGWIAERWNVTIKSVDVEAASTTARRSPGTTSTAIYVPKTRLREAAGNTLRESQVAAIIDRHGLLAKRTEADRLYVRFVPKIGRVAAYALRRSEFGRSDQTVDPDAYAVHQGAAS